MSPLAEGRELKFFFEHHFCGYPQSPLAEGRELKFRLNSQNSQQFLVAPRGGA